MLILQILLTTIGVLSFVVVGSVLVCLLAPTYKVSETAYQVAKFTTIGGIILVAITAIISIVIGINFDQGIPLSF